MGQIKYILIILCLTLLGCNQTNKINNSETEEDHCNLLYNKNIFYLYDKTAINLEYGKNISTSQHIRFFKKKEKVSVEFNAATFIDKFDNISIEGKGDNYTVINKEDKVMLISFQYTNCEKLEVLNFFDNYFPKGRKFIRKEI